MEGFNFNDVSVTASAHSNQHETTSSGGKKRKWYLSEWFERRRDTRTPKDPNSLHETSTDSPHLFKTCVSCEWQSYAKVYNATQLGHHLLRCPQVPKDVKTRLLQEKTLLKHDRKRRRGHSQLFGTQITPTKPRSSYLYLSRENIQPSNTIQRNDSNYGTLDFGSDATLPVNVRVESEDSYRKRTTLNELVTRFVINDMLPFSTLSRRPGKDLFFQIAKILNPEFSEQLPTADKMSERNLSAYYDYMLNRVKCSITSAFNSSYGTLLFDGWTDISNESVVNVLLSITGVERVRKTFFLRSIYTGSQKCRAQFYASALEEVMGSFGSMVNICAVVSDNTSCCVKAKQLIIDKHNHLLSCQDQTHVANLLMQDLGSVKWISGILQKVTSIVSELRRHPKLYHRFKELKDQHNLSLLADASHLDALQGAVDHYGRPALPRTAVLPCRMATTRFASSESMLRSVLRSEKLYHRLIECPDFESTLYGAPGARGLEKRREFQSLIQDRALMRDALDVFHILRLVRQYLRLFDDESSLISEVFPATRELRYRISVLPLTAFFNTDRRDEVLSVFDERLRGSTRRIPLLTPLHRVAFYLDIRSTYQDLSEDREHVSQVMRDFVRSDVFPIAEKAQDRGGEDRAVQLLLQELSLLRLSWRSCGTDDTRRNLLWCYTDIPLVYWIEYDDKRSLLREFALRNLGTSPSSSSVERSFSHQGRIRTSVRNRLNQQKVMRMVFCSFNDLLFSERSLRIEQVAKREYQNIRFGGWNRSINTKPTSSLTTISNVTGESNLFEEFFGYEDGADGDIEEIEEVEVDDFDVDQDGLAPTSEVMDFFGYVDFMTPYLETRGEFSTSACDGTLVSCS